MNDGSSPLTAAVEAVGDRWTLLLIEALLDGPARFGDLQGRLAGVSPNILSERLRRLEAEGLIVAQPYSERPPRYAYELAASGHELAGALRLLAAWGARQADEGERPTHAECGEPLEVRWWCPACERAVEPGEEHLHYA